MIIYTSAGMRWVNNIILDMLIEAFCTRLCLAVGKIILK